MKRVMILFLALAFVFSPLLLFAQQTAPSAPGGVTEAQPPGRPHGGGSGGQHGQMMQKRKGMQAKHQQAQEDMQAMDARLDEKIAAMNNAKGDQKMSAMADVINELASQRKEMRDKFSNMHQAKMCGMMGKMGMHGQGGGQGGGMGMGACCPMMQQQGQQGDADLGSAHEGDHGDAHDHSGDTPGNM
jgi:hypothetical protein